jgi:phosphoribosyl-AMP cyclohydrolase
MFSPRTSVHEVEEGASLSPKFDEQGLISCVTTDVTSGRVLMLGYMSEAALRLTIETGYAHYFSRSRRKVWRKGDDSGLKQEVVELLIDDDQDALLMKVNVAGNGASCHVGYHSCFYRRIPIGAERRANPSLRFIEAKKVFDPLEVYGDVPNPTQL